MAAEVLNFQNRLERILNKDSQVSAPPELLPFHQAPPNERNRRIRRVLAEGFVNWRKGGVSIIDAVRAADPNGGAVAHFALNEMRKVLLHLNLDEWEKHPARLRAEVHSLFRRAIGRVTPHRGGWFVRPRAG